MHTNNSDNYDHAPATENKSLVLQNLPGLDVFRYVVLSHINVSILAQGLFFTTG